MRTFAANWPRDAVVIGAVVTGGHPPGVLLRVPGDRKLKHLAARLTFVSSGEVTCGCLLYLPQSGNGGDTSYWLTAIAPSGKWATLG